MDFSQASVTYTPCWSTISRLCASVSFTRHQPFGFRQTIQYAAKFEKLARNLGRKIRVT